MSPNFKHSSDLPVIDVGLLGDNPSTEVWRRIGRELVAAFSDFGYAYVVNHGVPDDSVNNMFEATTKFFTLPADEKETIKSDGFHGYISLGRQRIGENYEHRETFDIRGKNDPLPDALVPELRSASLQLKPRLAILSFQIFRALEHGLDLKENQLLFAHSHSLMPSDDNSLLRLTHYPPVPSDCPPNLVRLDAHTDYGSMTLDIQDEHGGLEVRNRQGEWVKAHCPHEGAMLVIMGDTMEQWTNGKLQATPHRVTVPADDRIRRLPRRSIIYFCVPNFNETLAPFDGSPSDMSHITVKEYLSSKQRKTLDY